MNIEEHAAKPLLRAAGIATPEGRLCTTPTEARDAAAALGPCMVKAQVPAGKRGKAGGIRPAATPEEAGLAAESILAMTIAGHPVERLLVEQQAAIAEERYLAIVTDAESKSPRLLYAREGGMDIEEIAASSPEALLSVAIDIRKGIDPADLPADDGIADLARQLYDLYRSSDAELIEINPLALTDDGRLVALDCKLVIDDAAAARQPQLAALATPERPTELEARAAAVGLRYIELDGTVGVLANGAGLTMTTMDAVRHFGGSPANFLEIGGDAYTRGKDALAIVLANPRVKSLIVNFCGAFARTDVMAGGLVEAWAITPPRVPVFFTVHGTGDEEAVALLREKLGIEPYDIMDDAIVAAVEAAR